MKNIKQSNGLWINKDGKKVCYNPWTHFEVNNPNGDVTMCCDNPIVLGNVNEQSIEEIWNGKPYQDVRKKMYALGGEKMCNPDCLLLNGAKNNESLADYQKIDNETKCYKNSLQNEAEIRDGETVLRSKPRLTRFLVSYACNFTCYHCDQVPKRKLGLKLPEKFFSEAKSLLEYSQILYLFGGEPMVFAEFRDFLNIGNRYQHLKYGIVSNGSLIHKHIDQIRNANWSFISISLDAATEETFEEMRGSKSWGRVMDNLQELSNLKKSKNFRLIICMTVNSKNYNEIYKFVELAKKFMAIPAINIVTNSVGTDEFENEFLTFDSRKRKRILDLVNKIKNDFPDIFNETGLAVLKKNAGSYYRNKVKNTLARIAKKRLPPFAVEALREIRRF